MRKSIVVAVSLLFLVAPAFAQHPAHSNTVSVFVSDLTLSQSRSSGASLDAGYGAAFDHMFNDRLSGEVSVTSERQRRTFGSLSATGALTLFTRSNTIYPVDANVSYHFLTNSRWKPYAGVGMRYVSFTSTEFSPSGRTWRTVNPEVSGGITFQFRPNLGLRFDAKQILGGDQSIIADPAFKASVGLSFRF
jgi:outer membrane protein W